MVAKGKDASSLFPAVVKNVVGKNLEVCIHTHVLAVLTSFYYFGKLNKAPI